MDYRVQIDIDKDETFPSAGDISDRVFTINWELGFTDSETPVAAPLSLQIEVVDTDRAFSLDGGIAPFNDDLLGCLVRVQAELAGVWTTLIQGWLIRVKTSERRFADFAELEVSCNLRNLQTREYIPRILTDIHIDDAIRDVFSADVLITYPYASAYFSLDSGRPLSDNLRLYGADSVIDIDDSDRVLPFVGDNSNDGLGVAALGYLWDLVIAELPGFLYSKRDAKLQFNNRYHYNENPSITVMADEYSSIASGYGALVNRVTVNWYPRRLGSPGTVLYRHDGDLELDAGDSQTIRTAFLGLDGTERIGAAVDILPLESGLDYIISEGADVAVNADVSANDATFEVKNNGTTDAILTRLQVRGTPLYSLDADQHKAFSIKSINENGEYEAEALDYRLIADQPSAEYAGTNYLNYREFASLKYDSIIFDLDGLERKDSARADAILGIAVGDIVRVQNSVTGHDKNYMILGENHSITGMNHRLEWYTIQANTLAFWILGTSALDENTRLAL